MKPLAMPDLLQTSTRLPATAENPHVKEPLAFAESLTKALSEVDNLQDEANAAIRTLAIGEDQSIHETMIALEKAEISFQLMMQVRNKIISAYEEIMRMQI